MTTTQSDLDPFQTAVLHELRSHVEHRASSRRRRRRLIPSIGAAAAALAVAGTAVVTAVHPTPAFAVTQASNGDVTIAIHELTDAHGLETALRSKGLDAYVAYTPDAPDTGTKIVLRQSVDSPASVSDADPVPSIVLGDHGLTDAQRAKCDISPGASAATVHKTDDDYRITILKGSPLQDRFFAITGVTAQAMTVSYGSADGHHACLVR